MTCYVYHICHEKDKYDFSRGYVGISSNPQYRWMRHKKYEKRDGHLQRAYNKYSDIIEYIILIGTRSYCLLIESLLRPNIRMGWNMDKGGGSPPNLKNKIMSQEQKDKIGKANSGRNCSKWKGWWIVDDVIYDTTIEVSKVFNVTTKTVCDRAKNPNFPNWKFQHV